MSRARIQPSSLTQRYEKRAYIRCCDVCTCFSSMDGLSIRKLCLNHCAVQEARSSGSSEEVSDQKAQVTDRKARKKAIKAQQRAKRSEGGQPKPCGKCGCDVELLIRCQIDADQEWWMVCGKCWPLVSGGVTDGDAAHPHYRYGGLWKI